MKTSGETQFRIEVDYLELQILISSLQIGIDQLNQPDKAKEHPRKKKMLKMLNSLVELHDDFT